MQEQLSPLKSGIPSETETTAQPTKFGTGFFEIRVETPVEEKLETLARAPRHGNETATLLANADLLYRSDEKSLATHLVRKCLYLNPYHPEALKRLGQYFSREVDLPLKTQAMQALTASELSFENLAKLGHCYYQQNQDQKAFAIYHEALSILTEPSSELFEVFKNLGNIQMREGDFDGAEELYNKAFNLNSKSDVLNVNLGTLALQRGENEEALRRFREALELNSRNDKAWVGLAVVHNAMGDFVLARANLENALDTNPENRTAVHLAANWAVRDQDLNFATEALENYVSLKDCDEEMSLLLVHLFCLRSQYREALFEVERILLWNPRNVEVQTIEHEIKREMQNAGKV